MSRETLQAQQLPLYEGDRPARRVDSSRPVVEYRRGRTWRARAEGAGGGRSRRDLVDREVRPGVGPGRPEVGHDPRVLVHVPIEGHSVRVLSGAIEIRPIETGIEDEVPV